MPASRLLARLADMSPEEFDLVMNVNAYGPVRNDQRFVADTHQPEKDDHKHRFDIGNLASQTGGICDE